jgi:hypothetical protein
VLTEEEYDRKMKNEETKMLGVQHLQVKNGSWRILIVAYRLVRR